MRPALLVIIMDFLVSSLLLFISGPGAREEGAPRRAVRGPTTVETAPEFAPAAVAEMEQQWTREYQQQLAETKISTQAEQLAALDARGRELAAARTRLEEQVWQQSSELDRRQTAITQLTLSIAELREARAQQDAALEQTRQQAAQLAQEKDAVAAARDALRQRAEQLAAAKAATEKKLGETEAQRQALTEQAGQLRQRLTEQAVTIQRQTETLASQQQTIREDLRGLAQTQTRIEDKAEAIRRGQADMQNALARFQTFAAGLPQEWKESAQQIAAQQARLTSAVTGLTALVRSQSPAQGTAEQQLVKDRIETLTGLNRDLNRQLATLATTGLDTGRLGEELRAVRRQQQELQEGIGGLASKLGAMETRQIGPFAKFRDARLAVCTALTAVKIGGVNAPGPAPSTFNTTSYAPLLFAGGRFWLVVHVGDLGVTWGDLDADLDKLNFSTVVPGLPAVPLPLHGPAHTLAAEPRLALLDLRQEPAIMAALADRSRVKPTMLLGRAGLEKRGVRDLYVFKRTAEGLGFAVDIAPDLGHPGYLLLRNTYNRFINFLSTQLVSTAAQRPEAGDFVVTSEGAVVGVMVDAERAYVLADADIATGGRPIALGTPRDFARDALDFRQTLK
jgi:hypothetical protein